MRRAVLQRELDVVHRTVLAAGIVGIRAMAVHAKDETAAAFYRRFDFMASPNTILVLSMQKNLLS